MITQLLSKSNSDEIIGIGTTLVDVVEKSAYKDSRLEGLKEKLSVGIKDLTTAQNRKRKNDETEEVWNSEKLRDKGFQSFKFAAKGVTLRSDKVLSDFGKTIYEVIKRHGLDLHNLPHAEQTAKMQSLFGELETPICKTAIDGSSLTDVYAEMKASNQVFLDGLAKRTISDAIRKEAEGAVIARKNAKHLMDQFINYLNSIGVIDNSTELKDLSNRIVAVIDKANANIHARITRDNTDDVEDDVEVKVVST